MHLRYYAREYGLDICRVLLNPGIRKFERETGLSLPDDFIRFYSFCAGFEYPDDMFRILPLSEISEKYHKDVSRPFFIAEYMIYGFTWEVEWMAPGKAQYQIIGFDADGKKIVFPTLANFISRFLTGGLFEKGGLLSTE